MLSLPVASTPQDLISMLQRPCGGNVPGEFSREQHVSPRPILGKTEAKARTKFHSDASLCRENISMRI